MTAPYQATSGCPHQFRSVFGRAAVGRGAILPVAVTLFNAMVQVPAPTELPQDAAPPASHPPPTLVPVPLSLHVITVPDFTHEPPVPPVETVTVWLPHTMLLVAARSGLAPIAAVINAKIAAAEIPKLRFMEHLLLQLTMN